MRSSTYRWVHSTTEKIWAAIATDEFFVGELFFGATTTPTPPTPKSLSPCVVVARALSARPPATPIPNPFLLVRSVCVASAFVLLALDRVVLVVGVWCLRVGFYWLVVLGPSYNQNKRPDLIQELLLLVPPWHSTY